MAPGATTLTSLVLSLMMITRCSTVSLASPSPYVKVLRDVRLPGGFMEVVQEEHCSQGIVRLTCRSLKAFIFVLEANYLSDYTDICGFEPRRVEKMARSRGSAALKARELRGNYIVDAEEGFGVVDIKKSLNKRCSGQKHCRYNFTNDQPGAGHWNPATLRLKYACIPGAWLFLRGGFHSLQRKLEQGHPRPVLTLHNENAVRRYCNEELKVVHGEGGFIHSPGFPRYSLGENTCGWTFRSAPGQRILLTFHDLDIRGPKADGSCVDVVRVREKGRTLFEHCGTAAGVKVVSNSNLITLDLVASKRLYIARGFFVHYEVLDCPDISTPNGSNILNGNLTSRTFLCDSGTVFPDSEERVRTLECKNGKWNENVTDIPGCRATSAVILKTEHDHRLSTLSGDNTLGAGVRVGRGEDAVATGNGHIMDSAQSTTMKQSDYVVDVVLPTVLIALLFVGNAIIVYIIFQYRKRKTPAVGQGEEMALRNQADVPQV